MGSSKKKGDDGNISSTIRALKEVLNDDSVTEFDIFSALKDFDMDPYLAYLHLSQDTFQQVKSKKEKRNKMKETREMKTQEKNSDTCSADKVAPSASQTNSNDTDKSVYKRDNMLSGPAPYHVKTSKDQHSRHSDILNKDNTKQKSENMDSVSLSAKRPASTLVTWNRGVPYSGHITMADVVRMGKLPGRHSQTAAETTYTRQGSNSQFSLFNHLKPFHDSSHSKMGVQKDQQGADSANVGQMNHESFIANSECNDWSGIERLTSISRSSNKNNFRNECPGIEQNNYDGSKFPARADKDVAAEVTGSTCLTSKVIQNFLHPDNVSHLRGTRNSISPSANNTASLNAMDFQKPIFRKKEARKPDSEDTYVMVGHSDVQDIATEGTRNSTSPSANNTAFLNDKVSSNTMDLQKPNLWKKEARKPDSEDTYVMVAHSDVQDIVTEGRRSSISSSANNTGSLNDKVPSNTVDFQKAIWVKKELRKPVSEDTSAVAFPSYVQDIATDLSHLSFGTYNSGLSTVSESLTPDSLKTNLERDGLSASAHPFDPRNSWYADQIRRSKNLRSPQSESHRPSTARVPEANKSTSSSRLDPNYLNTINPDGRNPLYRELERLSQQERSVPTSKDLARSRYSSDVPSSVDPVVMSEASNSSAFSSPLSHYLTPPGVSLGTGSALPRSAIQHSYQDSGAFHDSLASVNRSVPQFGAGASRNSWLPSGSNDFLDGKFGSAIVIRRYVPDLRGARSNVGYGGTQPQYNEDILSVLQKEQNRQLSGRDYGSSSRAVPNVMDGRNHSLSAPNPLLFGYPPSQQREQSNEALGHSNIYLPEARTVQDQQLGPGGLPSTQSQPSRPSDKF